MQMNSGGAKTQGFTLVELMIVIAIAAVLLALAIPSFRTTRERAALRSAASGLYTAFERARTEAQLRNSPVAVCPQTAGATSPSCASGGNYSNGWVVYQVSVGPTGNGVFQFQGAVSSLATISNTPSTLFTFDGNGRASAALNLFVASTNPGLNSNRCVRVARSGRVAIEVDLTSSSLC